jgi:uncharacterized membrane protein YfcA
LFLLAGAVGGIALGTYVLSSYRSEGLETAYGVFLVLYALKELLWEGRLRREIDNHGGIVAGFLGGCLAGIFGAGGPPVVIFLTNKIDDKRAVRATLTLYFSLAGTWQFATYVYAKLITRDVLLFVLYMLPAFVAGNVLGSLLHFRIDQRLFTRVVALILLATGVSLIL